MDYEHWCRDDSWHRTKGGALPYRDGDGELQFHYFPPREKWPRFSADIPPELAKLLDAAQRKSLGVNRTSRNATRANLVRSALRLYLNTVEPEPEPDDTIEGTASDIIDLPALTPGAS